MAININNLNNTNNINSNVNNTNKTQVQQNAPQNSPLAQAKVAQDSVSITPQAQKLTDVQKKNNDQPEINSKKIDELRKSILDGDYKVDSEKLAANIADFEFELG